MSRFSEQGSGYSYKKCPSSKSEPSRVDRPCISKNYVGHILDRYKAVSSCVLHDSSISPKETFPLFAHESGFHLNVTSGSGCRGLGQLSRIAAHEMDQIDQSDLKKKGKPYSKSSLLEHSECAEFQKTLSAPIPDHSKKLGECEVIAIPDNPDSNLLYSLRLYRMLKDVKAHSLISAIKDRWPDLEWKETELSILQVRLAQVMYNGGYPSIGSNFQTFLATLKSSALGSDQKGETLWSGFKNYLYSHYPDKDPDRRKEVRDYVDRIEKTNAQIKESTGFECFAEPR
ncbi:MAG: hypothetical protein KGP28_02785 [Bdellovibrionales bacterium]|nr:hypothetical protein [Bdellovibrionales bacterium]